MSSFFSSKQDNYKDYNDCLDKIIDLIKSNLKKDQGDADYNNLLNRVKMIKTDFIEDKKYDKVITGLCQIQYTDLKTKFNKIMESISDDPDPNKGFELKRTYNTSCLHINKSSRRGGKSKKRRTNTKKRHTRRRKV